MSSKKRHMINSASLLVFVKIHAYNIENQKYQQWQQPTGGGFTEDLLRDLFSQARASPFGGFPFGTEVHPQDARGSDITIGLNISFMDAIKGAKKTIRYQSWKQCSTCTGTGMRPGSKPSNCVTCGGSGERTLNQDGFRIMMPCNRCGGAGVMTKPTDICSTCAGGKRVSTLVSTIYFKDAQSRGYHHRRSTGN